MPCNGHILNIIRSDILENSRTKFIVDKDSSVASIIFGHSLIEVFSDTKLAEAGILKEKADKQGYFDYNVPKGLSYADCYDSMMYACSIPKGTYTIVGRGFKNFMEASYKIRNLKLYDKQWYIEHW